MLKEITLLSERAHSHPMAVSSSKGNAEVVKASGAEASLL